MKSSAFILLTFKPYLSAVPFHNGFDDGHAKPHRGFSFQAGTAGFGELFKESFLQMLRYAYSGVGDRDLHRFFFGLDPDRDDTSVRGKLDGIGNKVVDDLNEFVFIDRNIDLFFTRLQLEALGKVYLRALVLIDYWTSPKKMVT